MLYVLLEMDSFFSIIKVNMYVSYAHKQVPVNKVKCKGHKAEISGKSQDLLRNTIRSKHVWKSNIWVNALIKVIFKTKTSANHTELTSIHQVVISCYCDANHYLNITI